MSNETPTDSDIPPGSDTNSEPSADWVEDDSRTDSDTSDDGEAESGTELGLIESIGLWIIGLITGIGNRFWVTKQTIATLIARRAGDTDDMTTVSDESEESREKRLQERAESIADTIDGTVGVVLGRAFDGVRLLVFTVGSLILRPIPKTGKLADSLIRSGVNLKKNTTGADALAFSMYGDQKVVPQAAYWQSKHKRYDTANGEEYSAAAEGHNTYNLFGVPIVFSLRKSADVFEPIQAYLASQREIGNWAGWVRNSDDKRQIVMGADPPDGEDGMILDWNKAWEQYYQKVDQENLHEQHRLGRLAELDRESQKLLVMVAIGCFIGGIAISLIFLYVLNNFIAGQNGTISLFITGWWL
jgi:hypothetical protein